MIKNFLPSLLLVCLSITARSQKSAAFVDSIMRLYQIPELGYAVVSSDSICEFRVSGQQRVNDKYIARQDDRFHIGSNTKAITAFLAAQLVQEGKIRRTTKIVDLFPELRKESRKIYRNITLSDLLSFRGKLPAFTYTNEKPTREQIHGDLFEQHYQLTRFFLKQRPMKSVNGLTPSNADYIVTGIMLEKAAGKSYKELIEGLGKQLNIHFGFGYPNLADSLQPWGHDANLIPVPPVENYKLDWLLSAGNINISLPDYIKFIQAHLQGLQRTTLNLEPEIYHQLLFGKPGFAYGWFNENDKATGTTMAHNTGNAGAFITRVQILKDPYRAYIIFTNAATEKTMEGVNLIVDYLKK